MRRHTTLTRAQREALKRVYDREPLHSGVTGPMFAHPGDSTMSYREFRSFVQPVVCDSAVIVPWCGIWLGIEPDGYTHS